MADYSNNNEKEEEFVIKEFPKETDSVGYKTVVVYSSETGVHYGHCSAGFGTRFYDHVRGSYGYISSDEISFENSYSSYTFDRRYRHGKQYNSGYGTVEFYSDGYVSYKPSNK